MKYYTYIAVYVEFCRGVEVLLPLLPCPQLALRIATPDVDLHYFFIPSAIA